MSQQPLHGLHRDRDVIWSRFLDADDHVIDAAWRDALATRQPVGTCRRCGQLLKPLRPYHVGRRIGYPAQCIADGCGHETAAYGAPSPRKKAR